MKLLWCHSHLVWLVFEGSIPTCTCFLSENFFVTCNFAFLGYHARTHGIDDQYVDGLSLTRGAPGSRQHIWTFASGLYTVSHNRPYYQCPCDNGNAYPSPHFVGNDYFCESVTQSSLARVSIQMLHSGMVRFVRVVAHAASSTIHHGSPRT